MTKEQKEAVQWYWQTMDNIDRYFASVFVSDKQTAFYRELLAQRAKKCAELGVPQTVTALMAELAEGK